MQLPNLIIIGVFKAATTSLFRYLSEHPDICGSKKKEIHYFTPLVYNTGEELKSLKYYSGFFSCNLEKYRLEASPAYYYGGDKVIKRMHSILPDQHKVILMLREPTDRFVSYFKHIRSQFLVEDDFPLFVEKCIDAYSKNPDFEIGHYNNAIHEGLYINFIKDWKEFYGLNMKIVFFEDLIKDPLQVQLHLSEWLNIDSEIFKNQNFRVENKTISPKYSAFHKLAILIYRFCQPVLDNSYAKRLLTDMYRKFNHGIDKEYEIDADSLKRIKDIYQPYNLKLAEYLGGVPADWHLEE